MTNTNTYDATRAPRTTIPVADLGFEHLGWTLHAPRGEKTLELTGGDWLRTANAPKPGDTTRTVNAWDADGQKVTLDLPLDGTVEMTPRPSEWSTTEGPKNHVGWPQAETHTWGEFAGLAVELGGYSDITLVDPGSGSRFWFHPGAHLDRNSPTWFWDALIEAAQAAKATQWGLPPAIDNEQPQG